MIKLRGDNKELLLQLEVDSRQKELQNKIKLAIHGKAKTGKDTAVKLIISILNEEIKDVYATAFAIPLKNQLIELLPSESRNHHIDSFFGPSELRERIVPGTDKTYRELLTEYSRYISYFNPNIWIDRTFSNIREFANDLYSFIIISDVRFKREFHICKERGFKLIKLTRPNNDYFSNDTSETDLDQIPDTLFDYHVVNDGSFQDLELKLKQILTLEIEQHGHT